eukprot:gene11338-15251_t
MVVAKNDRAHQHLSAQFADHGRSGPLERAYTALAWGALDRPRGTIRTGIDRSTKNREKMAVVPEGRGRIAITHVEAIETFGREPIASLIDCRLETGRTHQIRVHLASAGHPIAGDDKYGESDRQRALQKIGLKRMFLHAWRLQFNHPASGERVALQAGLPPELNTLMPPTALEAMAQHPTPTAHD